MPIIWIPKPSPIFIDRLSMTLDISESERQVVIDSFKNILPGFIGGKLYSTTSYQYNQKIYLAGGQLLIQCGPKNNWSKFFRLEWNPNNVDSEEVPMIVNLILPDGYPDLISYGRITRIDITTDVKNLKIEHALFHYPGLSVSYNHLKTGSIQAAYLGSKGSVNQFRFYDKVQEIKHNNAYKPKQYKQQLPQKPTTRIEWEYRPQKMCTFGNINELCEPIYKKLWCGMIANLPVKPATDFESSVYAVMKLSRYEGLQQALYSIAKHRRKEVLNFIKKSTHSSWWNPEKIWETFPAAIEPIVNPKPNEWAINS